ncbi:MAG TPA: LLM class flavin-dependent oxidoreductase [Pseudonocardia sp.]|jgi:alkanesulfonate monooxygenase SsuD/methylene tetrahydromethanopterin reductase-like flavin-dependent oxidoreductase (luciferase family)
MRLGVTMPARTIELAKVPELARMAEDAGLDSVWAWELYRNPLTMLATSAQRTERIALGTGLAVAASRTPFEMANAAADIDELSGGRTLLGLGYGVGEFLSTLHSVPADRALTRMSEYLDVLRLSWQYLAEADAPAYQGQYYSFAAPPFNPWGNRVLTRPKIPVYLGAVRPNMLRLVGRKADGWIGYLGTPAVVRDQVRPYIAEGAEQAGRDPAEIDVTLEVICSVAPDREVAMLRARKQVGFYVCHPTSDPVVAAAGATEEVGKLRAAVFTDGPAALLNTSDELVHTFSLTGTPDEVRPRLAEWEGVLDHLVLHTPYVPPLTAQESEDSYRCICDTFRR